MWFVLIVVAVAASAQSSIVVEWNTIDFAWPSPQVRAEALLTGAYIPANNVVTGVKLDSNGTLYVTTPRWLRGVPVTMSVVDTQTGLLHPFPSWEEQAILFDYVQSMEIDSRDWMWILDVGRLNIFDAPSSIVNGQPKLVVYDLAKGCVVRIHRFPSTVLPGNNSFANDIVVDETRGLAYISDTWANGGIVVYDFVNDRSRRFDHVSLRGVDNTTIIINGVPFPMATPSDGIALTPDGLWVYYCALSSRSLWRVATAYLADFSLTSAQIGQHAELVTKDKGYSDGMAFDSNFKLYFGRNENNEVLALDVRTMQYTSIMQDNTKNIWADTFAFGKGTLLWTANDLPFFLHHNVSATQPNYRIWATPIGGHSYLSGKPLPASMPCLSL